MTAPAAFRSAAAPAPVLHPSLTPARPAAAKSRAPVAINEQALAAHGLNKRDLALAEVGTVLVLPDGSAWRVTFEGGLDPVLLGGCPGGRSIASDPAAYRGRA